MAVKSSKTQVTRADPGLSRNEGVQSKDVRQSTNGAGVDVSEKAKGYRRRHRKGFLWLRGRAVLSRVVRSSTTGMPNKSSALLMYVLWHTRV